MGLVQLCLVFVPWFPVQLIPVPEPFQTFVSRGSIRQQVMQRYPLLLNRSLTLHRLGMHAFQPLLVEVTLFVYIH